MSIQPSCITPVDPSNVLSRADAESLARRVLALATATETRVTITSTARVNTRFAMNQVSMSGEDSDTTITIRSIFGKRSANVTINRLDEAALAALVREGEALAQRAQEDSEAMPELGPQTYASSETARALTLPSSTERVAAVRAVTERTRAAGVVATGYIEGRMTATAIATSRGLFAYGRSNGASMTTTVRTPDGTGSGWAGANADDWGGIDAAALGAQATEKAMTSRKPVAIEPGRYTTVLEPTAVGNLVQLIASVAQARSADEGRSFFSRPGGGNKLGLKIVDERVTLSSDPAETGVAFDADGLPAEPVTWIERGVLKNLHYTRYWAQRQGVRPSTGVGAGGLSLRMAGGTTTLPQLVASTERGILVTRFWYIRSVDPRTILYTGLTRDGTFLIENGKVSRAIKNFRFNDSPIFMLNNIGALGPAVRVSASENGSPGDVIVMPPIKVRDFHFTSLIDAI